MADPITAEPTPQNPAPESQEPEPGTPRLAKLQAQIESARNPAAQAQDVQEPAAQEPAAEGILNGKVRVKWEEDAVREIDADELVNLARRGIDADTTMASAKKLLGDDLPLVKQISEAYSKLPENERQRLMDMLHGKTDGDSDDDFDPQALLEGEGDTLNGKVSDPRLDKLESTLAKVVDHIQQDQQNKQLSTLDETIGKLIDNYPDLKSNAGAAKQAKQSIINSLRLNPNQELETLVATAARDYHLIFQDIAKKTVRKAGVPLTAGPRGDEPETSFRPERGPTGDDLKRGKIADDLLQRFKEGQR